MTSLAGVLGVVSIFAPRAAHAAPPPPVDVVVQAQPVSRRAVAIEWNPVALLVQRISANVEVAPFRHHALIASPYYFYPTTAGFNRADSTGAYTVAVPSQKFEGFGVEFGYRYYSGYGGLRGFFAGPSLIAAWAQATAPNSAQTSFGDLGVAADVGYQALVADDWVFSLGGGVQYLTTTKPLPDQQAPANVYANRGVHPRVLFALGYAF